AHVVVPDHRIERQVLGHRPDPVPVSLISHQPGGERARPRGRDVDLGRVDEPGPGGARVEQARERGEDAHSHALLARITHDPPVVVSWTWRTITPATSPVYGHSCNGPAPA